MSEVIKICKTHGNLTADDIKVWPYKNKTYRRCKLCIKDKNTRYQKRMREDTNWVENKRKKDKLYWEENKERITEVRKEPERLAKRRNTYSNNSEHYRSECREKQKIYRKELHDSYIRKIMIENSILENHDIPEEMIKAKKALLLLKRTIRDMKK